MAEWLSISRLVDFILLGMALEAAWLLTRHRNNGQAGRPPMTFHLLSGALLLVAIKSVLASSPPLVTAAILGLAGLSHCMDLRRALLDQR